MIDLRSQGGPSLYTEDSEITDAIRTVTLFDATSASKINFTTPTSTYPILTISGDGSIGNQLGLPSGSNTWFGIGAGVSLFDNAGFQNILFGANAGKALFGTSNSYLGYQSGFTATTSAGNTAVGWRTLRTITTASYNTAVGYQALAALGAGGQNNNVAVGRDAGYLNGSSSGQTQLSNSVLLGSSVKALNNGDINTMVIGYGAIGRGSNTTQIGNTDNLETWMQGARLVSPGVLTTDAALEVYDNAEALTLFKIQEDGSVWSDGGGGIATSTYYGNDCIPNIAGDTGNNQTFYGYQAGKNADGSGGGVGGRNTAMGSLAAKGIVANALEVTAMGYSVLVNGGQNFITAIGAFAMSDAGITAASSYRGSTALGHQAGRYISGGATLLTQSANSLFLGKDARASANGRSNEIVIGFQATGNGSQTATIGNSNVQDLYIGTTLHLQQISNAAFANTANTGDANTDALINAMNSALKTMGLTI